MNLHKSKSTLAETSRTSGVDPNPSIPRARFVLLLLKLRSTPFSQSARSISSRIDKEVSVPAGGTLTSWWEGAMLEQHRRDVDHLRLYWSDVWSVIFISLWGHVCARVSVYTGVITGVTACPLGNQIVDAETFRLNSICWDPMEMVPP